MKTNCENQALFDMHLEYSRKATKHEQEVRELEEQFHHVFGYLPVHIGSEVFENLAADQQRFIEAYWKNNRVVSTRKEMEASRSLAEFYFNAYSDSQHI